MEEVYYWIGIVFTTLTTITCSLIILGYLLKLLINYLGQTLPFMWYLAEFVYYRKVFKDWVKDKERLPRIKKIETLNNKTK